MSRRTTPNRLTLIRPCGTCGRTFSTSADTPLVRRIDGKNVYYCSQSCKKASYKGKPSYKRRANEDRREYDKAYYKANREKKLAQINAYYAANRDDIIAFRRRARAAG
jgi:hypothetical protein